MSNFSDDICIIGGAGHVGLPLGLAFADKGKKVRIFDINKKVLDVIQGKKMPFIEYGAQEILERVLDKTLFLSSDEKDVARAKFIIIAIGTPVDEYLNPKLKALLELFESLRAHLNCHQTIIIRSTVYPRTCHRVLEFLQKFKNESWNVAYCPERISQGYAIEELKKLPQLVAGLSELALKEACELFSIISPKTIQVEIKEAELAKLFTNSWRYIQFATANQFYMMAQRFGVDFNHLRKIMTEGYERTTSFPSAGFSAGPCLLKDTMQLASFYNNNFTLGHSAMMINEGLPGFIVENLRNKYGDLSRIKVGILGMAFKADIDDIRDSLSYKLGKILRFNCDEVFYSDEFAKDPSFISKENLISLSDIIIIGVPHSEYKKLKIPKEKYVVDLWGIINN